MSAGETTVFPTPKPSFDDDLGAEDTAARVDLMDDIFGFAVEHLVPPHEARRRGVLDCLERNVESLLAVGGVEGHALGGQCFVDLRVGYSDPR